MKRLLSIFLVMLPLLLAAQQNLNDSLKVEVAVDYDYNIFEDLRTSNLYEGDVFVFQSDLIRNLAEKKMRNDKRNARIEGYRIRIFSDNAQTARQASLDVVAEFVQYFPDIPVYRIYDNPYFKVYVGDYRTKDDALKELKRISRKYKYSFIIPDFINFPKL